ncbi:STAS domain-containing protein [Thermopolyspora sp. NPDC052614]|uniref:STAS domain-containing protein n=1 Tax=Thermopolyspora sp. NPDC052614 TaxID=3155682 RepID=UPI0034446372
MKGEPMAVFITSFDDPEGTVVSVAPRGDLDVVGGMRLRRSILDAIDRYHPVHLDLDLAYVTFLDCAGIRALLWADDRVRDQGGTMAVLHASGTALWLLTSLGLDRRLSIRLDRPPLFTLLRVAAAAERPGHRGHPGNGAAAN